MLLLRCYTVLARSMKKNRELVVVSGRALFESVSNLENTLISGWILGVWTSVSEHRRLWDVLLKFFLPEVFIMFLFAASTCKFGLNVLKV